MAIIETHSLSRTFGKLVAVEDLTISVEAGEVLGLLGPNGAGKTTTVRMLAGMVAPTGGDATVDGLRPDKEPEHLHESIGLLTETPGIYARMSARRNLEFFASFYPSLDIRAQSEKYLRLTGLWDRRDDKAGGFSKGMKQRLALARCLVHEPKILFLDEPTSGLDPAASREIRTLVQRLSAEGRTILLSTHNLAEAEELCHRVAVIHTRVIALDTPARLRERFFRRQIVVQLKALDPQLMDLVSRLPFVRGLQRKGDRLHIDLVDPDESRAELVRVIVEGGGDVMGVTEEEHPLEEIYMRLISEEKAGDA